MTIIFTFESIVIAFAIGAFLGLGAGAYVGHGIGRRNPFAKKGK